LHVRWVERFEQVTKAPLVEGYGLTEAAPVVCFQPLRASGFRAASASRRR
jgi:long-chain acyl-CoA synthetase